MKIYIMSDLEGCAGVLDRKDWVLPAGMYYEKAKELLTKEINAAIEGFMEAGADRITVSDGHGPGGVDPTILHPEAGLIRGYPTGYPCELDESYDCLAWIGQHAKAGTPFAHIPHTGNHRVVDLAINGISVGEFGQLAMCAGVLGVKPIMAVGDLALCKEAEELLPGIETVSVKEGLMPGKGDECTYEEYMNRNIAALHISPQKARALIKNAAYEALCRYSVDSGSFSDLITEAPYEITVKYRPGEGKSGWSSVSGGHAKPWEAINAK